MKIKPGTGSTIRLLHEETLMRMFQDFSNWRIDPFIREMEAKKKKGRIFAFARGLRLSAHLIYTIREILSGTNLTANWGHLLDQGGNFCSCECDVIIHRKGYVRQWNGHTGSIMDFKFIEQKKAIAVISCKSYLKSGNIDRKYCKQMKIFVNTIWLFAECCGSKAVERIQQRASDFGYKKFWYLYTWSKKTAPTPNKNGWNDFVHEIKKLSQNIS